MLVRNNKNLRIASEYVVERRPRLVKVTCPDCMGNIDVPDDAMVGEIVSCPDCGLEFEVKSAENGKIELEKLSIEKEDWGE